MNKAVLLGAACAAGTCALGADDRRLTVTSLDVTLRGLPRAFDAFRILHLSDLHARCFGYRQQRLIRESVRLAPDIAVITGDLIDRRRTRNERDMRPVLWLIEGLCRHFPVLWAEGNHEALSSLYRTFADAAASAGAQNVTGRVLTLTKREDRLCVFGMPDIEREDFQLDEQKWNRELSRLHRACGAFPIVLSHRPQAFPMIVGEQLPLVLCGHAHGGQVRLPVIGGLYAPDQGLFPKYTCGRYAEGESQMVVSRGLGNSAFPLRVFNPPELVLLTLRAKEA